MVETLNNTMDDVFAVLKARRNEEESCLEFLGQNRRVLHDKCSTEVDDYFNDTYGSYLYKRMRYPSESERELKSKFKRAYANKSQFIDNRVRRNEEYVEQRKRDFCISQERVSKLISKLQSEYEEDVQTSLARCTKCCEQIKEDTNKLISEDSKLNASLIVEGSLELHSISESLSFVPNFYKVTLDYFQKDKLPFCKDSASISKYSYEHYFKPLRPDTQRLFITISEACQPHSMTPPLIERKCRSVCVISKPLVFDDNSLQQLSNQLGWRPIFAQQFGNEVVKELFQILTTTEEEDIIIFGFPRTPQEYESLYQLFNPISLPKEGCCFLDQPIPSVIEPFDLIIEVNIPDEIVLRDVLSQYCDQESGEVYDLRNLTVDTVSTLVNLERVSDSSFDILQYAIRSATLKSNFEMLSERTSPSGLYERIELESRSMNESFVNEMNELINKIPEPVSPKYSSDVVIPSLLNSIRSNVSSEVQEFIMTQWNMITSNYQASVERSFELLQESHLLLIGHLNKARSEMQEFLRRPGSSQHLVVEFQEWHSEQVERCMRRLQKVKDECSLRINSLRENLLQIENDRKSEEENKQKELLNAPFRTTLFELVNNACTMLAQAELDRWVSTRTLMLDLNQIVSDVDLVPPLPRRKLTQATDPSRDKKGKNVKKPQRNTPTSRNRNESKLQTFESPLFEQLESSKKFVTDSSVIYVRSTTPVSTRGKTRVGKDKNPFAQHKISALEEFAPAFSDEDVYLLSRLDQISELAHEELNIVQQSFDAYLEDSTKWIQTHYERRKSIAETAIAYMLEKVNEEAQLNHLIFLNEDNCTVDFTQMLVGDEEIPKLPLAFPEEFVESSKTESAETIMQGIVQYTTQTADNNL